MTPFTHTPESDDLFTAPSERSTQHEPLAQRMRPRTLDDFFGQQHLLAPGKLLRRAIEADRIRSLILYGPPGTGKTTLGHVISKLTNAHFEYLNSVMSNVNEMRITIKAADKRRILTGQTTILFIDEIHRFNKAQQDVLMPYVEEGVVTLIGATTHNPFFSLVGALLSRSMIFELQSLAPGDIQQILWRALHDKERGLGKMALIVTDEAIDYLAHLSDGDARRALNALEIGALTSAPDENGTIMFTREVAAESIQKKIVMYDQAEDSHYDTSSAFIKSMRGSDPDAALYWMAKMLYAGEDPRFIARRMVISAAEDVGNADPQALILANAALQIAEFVGLPECRIPLAQAVTYIATAPKSNAAYLGINAAEVDIKTKPLQPVPTHLKDASYQGAKTLGHGTGYKYAHDYPDHWVDQAYKPHATLYYHPQDIGYEKIIKQRLDAWRAKRKNK